MTEFWVKNRWTPKNREFSHDFRILDFLKFCQKLIKFGTKLLFSIAIPHQKLVSCKDNGIFVMRD